MAVRLRDVADHAGVSVKTVSNVVHGHPSVSRSMRARVQSSIEALGYVPNISARSLRTGRSGAVGLAVPRIDDPYFAEVAAAVVDVAARRGLSVVVEQTGGDPAREIDVLLGRRPSIIDGLIFSPIAITPDELDQAATAVPIVLLGEHLLATTRCRVAIDNVSAAAQAVGHLLGRGRRRVAAIGAKRGSTAATAELRLAGYRRALTESGVDHDPALEVAVPEFTRECGATAVEELLAAGTAFDGLFAFNDLLALGALEALRARGVSVPGDVVVAGFDDVAESRHASPPLTSIAPDLQVLAASAVDRLVLRLDDPDVLEGESIVVPHRLVIRESSTPGGVLDGAVPHAAGLHSVASLEG